MTRIFIHCVGSLRSLQTLDAAIPGFDRYPERALLLAEPGDVVCVSAPIDPDYLAYLAHLGIDRGAHADQVAGLGQEQCPLRVAVEAGDGRVQGPERAQ